ncbi:MAG TPA: flagellar motor switch protein FliN [Rhizobiaceae bacterium]|nr:flagellar motor switch protein FliN [Rhizobiaceae bacterium]
MNVPNPLLDEHQEDLDKAIDDLRGALHDAPPPPAEPTFSTALGDAMPNAGVVMNILVDVQIVLGSTEVPVSDLLTLQKGATMALNRRIGEPVDVVVNGRKIARGEITVLENDPSRFGVRVTEIVNAKLSN